MVSRRRIAIQIVLVILAVSAPAAVIYAATTYYPYKGIYGVSSGPEVTLPAEYQLVSGNPTGAGSTNYVNISTQNSGEVNFSGTVATEAQIDQLEGPFTNVSNLDVQNGNLTIDPGDKNETKVKGFATSLKFKSMAVNDGETDFIYTASSDTTITVRTNATPGTQYGAVDQADEEGLAVDVADANGRLKFSLPTGTHEVRIEELGSLKIRNESEPHGLITGAEVEIKIYENVDDNPVIISRADTDGDGEVDLTGLPVASEFTVTVKVPGYYNRSILLQDVSQQETVFLLYKNETAVNNEFTFTDLSGDFSPMETSEFVLQKAVNESLYGAGSGFRWVTIAGDVIGSDEAYETDLAKGDRYRIVMENRQGVRRILGPYMADSGGVKTITITEDNTIVVDSVEADIRFEPSVRTLPANSTTNVSAIVHPGDTNLASYEFKTIYSSGGSSTTLGTVSGNSPDGEILNQTIDLTGKKGGTVTLIVNFTDVNGGSGSTQTGYFVVSDTDNQYALLTILDNQLQDRIPSNTWPMFSSLLALLSTVLGTAAIARNVRVGTELLGLIALGFLAGFSMIGFWPWDLFFAVAVTWFVVVAAVRGL